MKCFSFIVIAFPFGLPFVRAQDTLRSRAKRIVRECRERTSPVVRVVEDGHTSSFTGANAAQFAQTTTCGISLAAAANCNISVIFTPAATASEGAHGFDGYFPTTTTFSTTGNSFAFSTGGGVGLSLSDHIAARILQADYLYTRLPNAAGNRQNNFRIDAGIVFRNR